MWSQMIGPIPTSISKKTETPQTVPVPAPPKKSPAIMLLTPLNTTMPPRTASEIQSRGRKRFLDCRDCPTLGKGETSYGGWLENGCPDGGGSCCSLRAGCTGIGGRCHGCGGGSSCCHCGDAPQKVCCCPWRGGLTRKAARTSRTVKRQIRTVKGITTSIFTLTMIVTRSAGDVKLQANKR